MSHFLPSSLLLLLYLAALLLPDNCLLKTLLRCFDMYMNKVYERRRRRRTKLCEFADCQWENNNNMFNLLSDLTLLMNRLSSARNYKLHSKLFCRSILMETTKWNLKLDVRHCYCCSVGWKLNR